ncbi:hypothetical protein AAFF_G00166260 [Aldrovandia affinis]|uniref:Uncharacterized protein n=1 Tax=Aldrovandia affinis TaxID=143900 RepID=A0AAD7W787_9TELE|nr:hypothetical protein AAFF_G00166260 [Aldrovandia affinis]
MLNLRLNVVGEPKGHKCALQLFPLAIVSAKPDTQGLFTAFVVVELQLQKGSRAKGTAILKTEEAQSKPFPCVTVGETQKAGSPAPYGERQAHELAGVPRLSSALSPEEGSACARLSR